MTDKLGFLNVVKARWASMAPREKNLTAAACAVVGLALLWWVGVAPARATLKNAETQHRELDMQLEKMRRLQGQAQALQAQPKPSYDDANRALEAAVRERLGAAGKLSVQGDKTTVTLTGVAPDTLAQWLAQARANARVLPSEARLTRNAKGTWDGTLVLSMPPR
jgi:general secretion pathway protein M